VRVQGAVTRTRGKGNRACNGVSTKEKCDELKTTVYVMEAVELYEPKKSNK
jgi:hypothetical protein